MDDPDTFAKPAYRIASFHTQKGLYVGIDMEQPAKRWCRYRRDSHVRRDSVGVYLDTSGEGRYGCWMTVALGGSQSDGTLLPSASSVGIGTGLGIRVPSLLKRVGVPSFPILVSSCHAQTLVSGMIKVYLSRKVVTLMRIGVSGLAENATLFMSRMQPLMLDGVAQFRTGVSSYLSSTNDFVRGDVSNKIGADLFWRPSTNFQATAFKPDFGSENDDVVVNLGAFETFFQKTFVFSRRH